jgi:hypothetical protein
MSFLPIDPKIEFLLKENYEAIRRDYLSLSLEDFTDFTSLEEVIYDPKHTGTHYWQIAIMIWNNQIFNFIPDKLKNSKTMEILSTFPFPPSTAGYSKLLSGGHIEKHHDADDVCGQDLPAPDEYQYRETGLIKFCLAVDVPEDGECIVIVENNKKILKNGDIYAFDEGSDHEAFNLSNNDRGIFIVSFTKKDLNVTT